MSEESPTGRKPLQVWLEPDQRSIIKAAAKAKGMQDSTWVRSVALEQARQELGIGPQPAVRSED